MSRNGHRDDLDDRVEPMSDEGRDDGTSTAVDVPSRHDEDEDEVEAGRLPIELWESRPVLAQVRRAAHARAVGADAVLGAVLARVAALVSPKVTLPATVGTTATLDLLVALVGPAGAGKSAAADVAADLVPIDDADVAVVPPGSGEGLVESYFGDVEVEGAGRRTVERRQVNRAVLAVVDEGQVLAELGARRGSTLLPTLRSAWSGAQLGQANASAERRRCLPRGTYRLALVLGIQPAHAVALLDDAPGGTPQRFLWLDSTDPTIPDVATLWPGPLVWRQNIVGPIEVADAVKRVVRARALARTRGEVVVDTLDAHRDLLALKVAALLARLDGRADVDADDWRLAETVLEVSCAVRSSILATAATEAHLREHKATGLVVRRAAAVDDDKVRRALDGAARAVARHVLRDRCGGCRRRCVSRAIAGRDREHVSVDEVLAEAERRDWLIEHEDRYFAGSSRPT